MLVNINVCSISQALGSIDVQTMKVNKEVPLNIHLHEPCKFASSKCLKPTWQEDLKGTQKYQKQITEM